MNQQAMLRKIKQLQKEMLDAEEEINQTEFNAQSGPVTMVMYGSKEIKSVTIDNTFKPEDNDDYEMLGDVIVALNHQLIEEIHTYHDEKMSKYSSMLGGMPGLF